MVGLYCESAHGGRSVQLTGLEHWPKNRGGRPYVACGDPRKSRNGHFARIFWPANVPVELLLKVILRVFGASEHRKGNSEFALALGTDGDCRSDGQPFRDSQNPRLHGFSFPQSLAEGDPGLWIFQRREDLRDEKTG